MTREPSENEVIDRALDAVSFFVERTGRLDLECTEMDDHAPAPCPKCERLRERIVKAMDDAYELGQQSTSGQVTR